MVKILTIIILVKFVLISSKATQIVKDFLVTTTEGPQLSKQYN